MYRRDSRESTLLSTDHAAGHTEEARAYVVRVRLPDFPLASHVFVKRIDFPIGNAKRTRAPPAVVDRCVDAPDVMARQDDTETCFPEASGARYRFASLLSSPTLNTSSQPR